jgi:CPA2 family monovalent cation:H+ antiporter-2
MDLFTQLILLILIGIIGGLVAKKFKMPVAIGYILASALVSNFSPTLHTQEEGINQLAEIGVTLLLFSIGIEFSLDKLLAVKKYAVIGGIIQIVLTSLLGFLILPNLGFSSYESFFIGAVFSFSSTAIVAQILEDRDQLDQFSSQVSIGWLILQDIAVVFMIILLSNFAPIENNDSNLFDSLIKSFILIAGSLVIGRQVLPRVLKTIAQIGNKELVTISAFGFSLGFALIAREMGVSSTLGAFLAGLMISESVLNHEIITEINPLQAIFSLIFFTTLGSLLSFSYLLSNLGLIILLVIGVMLLKFLMVVVINLTLRMHFKSAFEIGLNLSQIGEFAFLISQIAANAQWIDSDLAALISAVTLISMLLTPLLILNSEKLYKLLGNATRKYNPGIYRKLFTKSESENIIDEQLENHIIICGYGRVGKYLALALKKLRKKYVVIEMNQIEDLENFQRDLPFIVGDSTNIEILKNAGVEKAKVLVITLPKEIDSGEIIRISKALNPQIEIIIRRHHNGDEIDESEIFAVIEPEFEATMKMLEKLLHLMRHRDKSVLSWVRRQKKALQ